MIRILIVDDAPLIRNSLVKSIERYGNSSIVSGTAANGVKALEWLEEYYADLCITDIKMPAMDGLVLIERIKERYPWMATLVISSYDEFEYAKKSMQLEALDYILKPIDPPLLESALGRAERKLLHDREAEAAQLLIRRLPESRVLLDRWVHHVQTGRVETMPVLIVDTLEALQEWTGARHDLLSALANHWTHAVLEELRKEKLKLTMEEGDDAGLGENELRRDSVRFYYRLCAVRRLEEGSHRLFEARAGGRDQHMGKLVDSIKRYIGEHYADKINLTELAQTVSLSKAYMCTLFKQETQMTIWNYIISERMRQARDLLMSDSLKIYEIANRVGYEDVDHFTQLFKKVFGLSPQDYRKRLEA
ncbi:response regulator [Paenibacillus aurantius]|uniref:Response regulator n=1 Tax=Paenibacillus aurantius TaxID=2918900 RepID=A0AA96LG30_9BACL|nr:response regulator [Paenibacillus aurantius]WNQ13176.1 response regulator [Paenibacillus aurantius]